MATPCVETRNSLILVMNRSLLSEFVGWCVNCGSNNSSLKKTKFHVFWMWHCVLGWAIADVSTYCSASTFTVKQSKNTAWPWRWRHWFFETSDNTHPATQYNIQAELNLQRHSWYNLKFIHSFIHSFVFSLIGRVGRNQSPVMWPLWLWYTASWASSWGSLPLLSPAFKRSHFRRQVPVRPQRRERS